MDARAKAAHDPNVLANAAPPVLLAAPGTPSSIPPSRCALRQASLRPLEGAERRETRRLARPPGRLAKPPDTPGEARRLRGDGGAPLGAPLRRLLAPGSAFPGTRHLRQSQSSELLAEGS